MAKKSALEKERKAWEDYLRTIEEMEKGKKGKKEGFLQRLFGKLKFWGKGKEKPAVELERVAREIKKPAAAPEEKRPSLMERKPAAAEKAGEAKPFSLTRKSLLANQRVCEASQSKALQGGKTAAEAAKPVLPKKIAELPKAVKAVPAVKKKPVVPKKVALLPKAVKAVPAKKPGEVVVIRKKAGAGKPAEELPAVEEKPGGEISVKALQMKKAKKPGKKPKVVKRKGKRAKKPLPQRVAAKEIVPLEKAPPEVKEAVKIVKMARRTRGWYGDRLGHKRVALEGWRLRKRLELYHLRRKAKKEELSEKERKLVKTLGEEQKALRERIKAVGERIKALRGIERAKVAEERLLEKKAKEAGITIPKEALPPIERGKAEFRTTEDFRTAVEAVRAVAEELAAAVTKMPAGPISRDEELGLDDKISTTQKLIKRLEMAFYKRKISFDQFREKLFEYQSTLSELQLKKRFLEEEKKRKGKEKPAGAAVTAAPGKAAAAKAVPSVGLTPRAARALEKAAEQQVAGITPSVAKALEKMAERVARMPSYQGRGAEPPTQPVRERVIERVIERPHERGAEVEAPRKREAEERLWEEAGKPKAGEKPAARQPVGIAKEREVVEEKPVPAPVGKPKPAETPKAVVKPVEKPKPPMPKAREIKKPVLSERIGKAIEEKAAGKISKEQVDRIEEQLGRLLEKYKVPEKTITMQIQSLDSSRLVQDFHKLIGLIQVRHEALRQEPITPGSRYEPGLAVTSRKKEKIAAQEKEIVKAKIETDFDRVLDLVKFKGMIGVDAAAKELGIKERQLQEYAKVLEENHLVQLIYPPIGAMRLAFPGYLRWKEREKKKKAEEKKKKKKK